jgi:hypothetical protein
MNGLVMFFPPRRQVGLRFFFGFTGNGECQEFGSFFFVEPLADSLNGAICAFLFQDLFF